MPPRPRPRSLKKNPAPVSPWSALAGAMLAWSVVRSYLPLPHQLLRNFAAGFLRRHARRLLGLVDPYLTVTIAERDAERMKGGDLYEQAKAYLSHRCARWARALRAESAPGGGGGGGDRFVISMGDNEEVSDEFRGATVWWRSVSASGGRHRGSDGRDDDAVVVPEAATADDGRAYRLVFHRRHRELVVGSYLPHVCREGLAIMVAGRQRKLFTNAGGGWSFDRSMWRHVVFEHPSTFDTLAMDPAKKRDIMDDLDAFRDGKEYYARIGKAWKRGYLLYGPPGTGKSTMIAAMANYLDYDIYDIELTSVYTNKDLRKMFIETRGKSIIVIEDIDCSLDLTRNQKRKKRRPAAVVDATAQDGNAAATTKTKAEKRPAAPSKSSTTTTTSAVTLSGLLNFIDGLWSACGGERIIVFTTNHVRRLDPALIRSGRMDRHIEMSYCCFEAFKVLARNYLAVDTHPLFDDVRALLQVTNITTADVAELLTPKRSNDGGDGVDSCLTSLVKALKNKAKIRGASSSVVVQTNEEMVEDQD